ncbi:isocitrate/isopropylmalate dehydrogenase family protein [Methanosphaera sp. BMS]|uniref:isocitrate/isopropylmalate dehydrogenase family protein n=1 Tax=Methanosphaera sp. BMS TaxID=1789762 RepID=UPI000DC1DF77|nr:isocitrate/isopropylmalate dehydrogenase family protein [Methanosphaera sp. BMS]AWX32442.1 isocitrate dehydrogenase [Methanosphaera sp. BMS]
MFKITVIPGDGIGTEVIQSAVEILETLNTKFDFVYQDAGKDCYDKCGTNLPSDTIESCRISDATLFGAVTSIPQQKSAIVTLRRELDLYVNQRPIRSYEKEDINFTIIRENSEGLYANIEEDHGDECIATRKITYNGCERIIKYAFEYANKTNRKRVTASHKANVLPVTDGIFKDTFYNIAEAYKNIESDDYYIDATAMYLITKPEYFEVIVTTNLFGDILSDEAAGVVGSLGLLPSANIGDETGLFEPVHGSAPDIAGKNKANPIATILSSALMLEYLGINNEAELVNNAVEDVIKEGKVKTPDLGGNHNTNDITTAILQKM